MSEGDKRSAYELSEDLHVDEIWEKKNPFVEAMKTGLLGALCGAVLTVVIGFAVGGWVTGEFADERARQAAEIASLDTKATICVGQFLSEPDWRDELKQLLANGSFGLSSIVSNRGWAIMPGDTEANTEVAAACGDALLRLARRANRERLIVDSPLGGYPERAE